jgi:dihydropyrimidinase
MFVTHEMMVSADIWIEDERVRAIGADLPVPPGAEIVDASGLLVLPGIVDAHTHLKLDTGLYQAADSWLEGSLAAAFGGITTVVDFATQSQGQSFEQALANRLAEASESVIDYAFHMMVTDVPPGQEEELGILPELGIQSIKLYTTYRPIYYADDATLVRLLEAAARYGLISLVHCENDTLVTAQTAALVQTGETGWAFHGASRPPLAEQEATSRVLLLAKAVGAPVVIAHASTGRTSLLAAEAHASGQIAFSETTPQYLLLDETLYEGSEPWRYILQPPLRARAESEALWRLVSDGRVDMIVTDHCDYSVAQKMALDDFTKTPGGLPGTETSLLLMATYGVAAGRLEWPDLVRLMSTNPARIYNLWPRKGTLMPGSDADLVLFDPAAEGILTADDLHMVAGYTPFEGVATKGRVVSTLRRGTFLVRDGAPAAKPGSGAYIRRGPRFWD